MAYPDRTESDRMRNWNDAFEELLSQGGDAGHQGILQAWRDTSGDDYFLPEERDVRDSATSLLNAAMRLL